MSNIFDVLRRFEALSIAINTIEEARTSGAEFSTVPRSVWSAHQACIDTINERIKILHSAGANVTANNLSEELERLAMI